MTRARSVIAAAVAATVAAAVAIWATAIPAVATAISGTTITAFVVEVTRCDDVVAPIGTVVARARPW